MAQDARIASKKGARNACEGSRPVGGLERATTKKGLTVVVFAEEKKNGNQGGLNTWKGVLRVRTSNRTTVCI